MRNIIEFKMKYVEPSKNNDLTMYDFRYNT